jgi:hypothetical protein
MKLLLTIFLTLTLITTNAQTMVDTGKVWNVVGCLNNFVVCGTTNYSFGTDTIIGIQQYKLLNADNDSGFLSFYEPIALREDTINRQVFFYDISGENLIYDFSITQGASYSTTVGGCDIGITADSVDTIILLSGESRKRMQVTITAIGVSCLPFTSYTETWIEGIGSLMGLTKVGFYTYVADVFTELICFHENDTVKYHDTQYPSCFYSTVVVNELSSKNLIKIFPNPASDFISIRADNSDKIRYVIISNVFGEVLLTTDKTEIDLSEFSTGIYFVQVITESGNYISKVLKK